MTSITSNLVHGFGFNLISTMKDFYKLLTDFVVSDLYYLEIEAKILANVRASELDSLPIPFNMDLES